MFDVLSAIARFDDILYENLKETLRMLILNVPCLSQ